MLTPVEVVEKIGEIGKKKTEFSPAKMLTLGMFGGAFIALAGVGSTFANTYVGKLAGACVFPVGLIMVLTAGSELFTGNNLMVMAALRRKITWRRMLLNWLMVFIGNFLGALLVSVLVVYSGVLDGMAETVAGVATAKMELGFLEAILRGVLCNFLVCIAVWMSFASESMSGKILAIFGPVMLFVLCGFEHSVANMYYGPAGVLVSLRNGMTEINFGEFLLNNLLPVTIGNIIGGAGFVGLGYFLAYNKK